MKRKQLLAILGSGRGSNFVAIQRAILAGNIPARVVAVFSDTPNSGIIERAGEFGIPAENIVEHSFRTRLSPAVEEALANRLLELHTDFVVLAGYMRVVKKPLLDAFPRRIINIHPSLLPAFRGLAAWKQAVEAGVSVTGCTVHLVDEGVDTGEILGREEVPVLPGDTPESLHARIQEAEHRLYPAVLAELCERSA